jgi:signal peptidase I
MAIRHFCLEAFRIPTASMEPMLYGDPGITKGDHVVVDKLTPRFTGYTRWDVTVFQFPRPELEYNGDARPAITASGDHLDTPLLNPLFCRNFVKRMVALPGDVFYLANGDLHLKQPDGTFVVARKPASTQEALWQVVYEQGDQAGYTPWAASGTSAISAAGTTLTATLGDQPIVFTQPLRNVYLKPGLVRATRRFAGDGGALVEVAMTKPVFTANGQTGNLWDLDNWEIERLTAKDLDAGHGTKLNAVMDEWVGDVRLAARIKSLDGTAAIRLEQGTAHSYQLELTSSGWRVTGDNQAVLGSGSGSLVGRAIRFGHLDSQIALWDGRDELLRVTVPEADPSLQRVRLSLVGTGALALEDVQIQRDVHYCNRGFLRTEPEAYKSAQDGSNSPDAYVADKSAENLRLMELVRSQMRGKENLTVAEQKERWGYSPETAVTVPKGAYLLMGDNSPFSWDSRWWGWVPEENLRGRALLVMFPPPRWRLVR